MTSCLLEKMIRFLPFFITFLPLVEVRFDICSSRSNVEAVFYDPFNFGKTVILLAGNMFWEYDISRGIFTKKEVSIQKYWSNVPFGELLAADYFHKSNITEDVLIIFTQHSFFYDVKCTKGSIYDCEDRRTGSQLGSSYLRNVTDLPPNKRGYKLIAYFDYQTRKGMPAPPGIPGIVGWSARMYNESQDYQLNCFPEPGPKVYWTCATGLASDLDLYPNYYTLNKDEKRTGKSDVHSISVFYHRDTQMVDFFIVGKEETRFTFHGKPTFIKTKDLFGCSLGIFWVVAFLIVAFIAIIVLVIWCVFSSYIEQACFESRSSGSLAVVRGTHTRASVSKDSVH